MHRLGPSVKGTERLSVVDFPGTIWGELRRKFDGKVLKNGSGAVYELLVWGVRQSMGNSLQKILTLKKKRFCS